MMKIILQLHRNNNSTVVSKANVMQKQNGQTISLMLLAWATSSDSDLVDCTAVRPQRYI
jgi:hypothetical protein